jgi:hypothetical protein
MRYKLPVPAQDQDAVKAAIVGSIEIIAASDWVEGET